MVRGGGRQHPRQFLGGAAAAGVKLVHQRQIVDRQPVHILPGSGQRGQDAVEQTLGGIMRRDIAGHGGASAGVNDPHAV